MDFDYSAGDVFSQSQDTNPSQSTQGDGLNTTIFKGDNLLEQPHKVSMDIWIGEIGMGAGRHPVVIKPYQAGIDHRGIKLDKRASVIYI